MTIYQSEFLNIYKEENTFIQSWTEKVLDVEDYKNELCKFMDLFYKFRPKEIIIDVKKCRLVIPEELDAWMADKVLIPISKKGIKKLSLTIAEEAVVHIAIATSLDKVKPIIQSSYFSDLDEARSHSEHKKNVKLPKFECQPNASTDSIDIDLNIDSNDLPRFLTSMKQIESDNKFAQNHLDRYNTLTFREIEILKLIALGKTSKQIGQSLFIEESSVKSHRKNIKQKLNITSPFDIYQFARCFKLI
jgi:DNA-binding CsgD family transcriptional regulator